MSDYYIPPKKEIKTFTDFYDRCSKLYDMYEPWFFLQGFECFTNFEGNEIDKGCWYCKIKLKEHTHVILAFQYGGDVDYPFVTYTDWAQCDIAITPRGFYTECEEYDDLGCAFYDMVNGYSRYKIRSVNDLLLISEKNQHDSALYYDNLSLLEAIDYIHAEPKFKGKTIDIIQRRPHGDEILYRATMPKEEDLSPSDAK